MYMSVSTLLTKRKTNVMAEFSVTFVIDVPRNVSIIEWGIYILNLLRICKKGKDFEDCNECC